MTESAVEDRNKAPLVLIAPDKFKGSLSAHDVAMSIARGMRSSRFDLGFDICPVADGGEGTLDAAISAGFRRVEVQVEGPVGDPVMAAYAERDGVAVVELAEAAGLRRLPATALAPMTASSYGAGQLIDVARRAGNRTIVIAVGGSASSDGGSGLVQALGAGLFDPKGEPLGRGGGALSDIDHIDLTAMNAHMAGVRVIIATDVDSPLLGPHGAAPVFGPQKGASATEVAALEHGLTRWASVVRESTGVDAASHAGAGAAGGVGFAAITMLGASVVRGADMVLDMVRFSDRVRKAALVITGEGSLDDQSLRGKAPIRVAHAARTEGVPAIAVAGRCTLSRAALAHAGLRKAYVLQDIEPDLSKSIADASDLLERIGTQIARAELGHAVRATFLAPPPDLPPPAG